MTWVPCNCCDTFWCTAHKKHAHDCECPPAEEWTTDPYSEEEEDTMLFTVNEHIEKAIGMRQKKGGPYLTTVRVLGRTLKEKP